MVTIAKSEMLASKIHWFAPTFDEIEFEKSQVVTKQGLHAFKNISSFG